MPTPTARLEELAPLLERFAEWTPPGSPGQPSETKDRPGNRVESVVAPFTKDDDSAVLIALSVFATHDKDLLQVVHPDPAGIGYFDLSELALRLADIFAGRFEVFTGHPDDPFARAGVLTRREPYPVLNFVYTDRLLETEHQVGCVPLQEWETEFAPLV